MAVVICQYQDKHFRLFINSATGCSYYPTTIDTNDGNLLENGKPIRSKFLVGGATSYHKDLKTNENECLNERHASLMEYERDPSNNAWNRVKDHVFDTIVQGPGDAVGRLTEVISVSYLINQKFNSVSTKEDSLIAAVMKYDKIVPYLTSI